MVKRILTQSRFHPGAVRQAGRPGLCDASPADTPSRPSWQTLDLRAKKSIGEGLEHRDPANRSPMAPPLTSFVTVAQFLGDPLDGFSSDFGAEVSVKW